MKIGFIFCFLFISESLYGQNYITSKGEYMDTTLNVSSKCSPPYNIFYYQLKAKYPVASATLLNESKAFMKQKMRIYSGTGYVTFKFFIDCEGTMSRIKVMQTDDNYKAIHFEKSFVNDLYGYLQTMDKWKRNLDVENLKNVNYIAFISFKIKNGEVINIIP